MTKPKKQFRIPPLSPDEALRLQKIAEDASRGFVGQMDELENALGMLMLGRFMGWRYLVLIHNKRSLRKYEEILAIDIREEFDEEGPLIEKSPAYTLVKKLGAFWKAVSGEQKLENRRALE